ncbi:MAG: SpoIIIAH-like family protein [Clostridia bacterium]|nr:SpoIIIAH-like family protein [Clostridia bacterium]
MIVKRPQPLRFALFLLILAAIFLYASAKWQAFQRETLGSATGDVTVMQPSEPGTSVPGEMLIQAPSESESSVATLAPASGDDYYVEARLERERARSEEGDLLQKIVDDPQSSVSARQEAEQKLMALAQVAEQEAAVEAVLRAKGYKDAVVLLANGTATVVLKVASIGAEDVARAVDAVTRITDVPEEAINVLAKP